MLAAPTTEGYQREGDEGAGVRETRVLNVPMDVTYRCPALSSPKSVNESPNKDDRSYRELLLKCRIAEYGLLKEAGESGGATSPQRPNTRRVCKRSGSVHVRDTEERWVLLASSDTLMVLLLIYLHLQLYNNVSFKISL